MTTASLGSKTRHAAVIDGDAAGYSALTADNEYLAVPPDAAAGVSARYRRGMAPSIVECPQCGAKNRLRPSPKGTPSCAKCRAKLPWEAEADADDFSAEVRASVPVLVDFWAPWCAPCRTIAPVLKRLARQSAGSLKVVRVNIDENPSLAGEYHVQSIPLLVLFADGREVDRAVGALPPAQLEAWLAPHLGSPGR